jgi:putative membrane protein
MKYLAFGLTAFVAAEHLYILWLEMFAWEAKGKKVFKGALAPELFAPTKTLAANQGLYNGFLAAGLIWSLLIVDPQWQIRVAEFFLCCVAIAGVYGACTASRKILLVQTIPACLTLITYLFL